MLAHWAGKVALPAVVCAAALTLLTARSYRRRQSVAAGVTLLFSGIALLLLPVIASYLAPEVQGNGQHVNESAYAGIRCWIIGIPVLTAGMFRFAFLLALPLGNAATAVGAYGRCDGSGARHPENAEEAPEGL
ncbi:hypothetical protein [Nonomuraea sp. NPDC002799]